MQATSAGLEADVQEHTSNGAVAPHDNGPHADATGPEHGASGSAGPSQQTSAPADGKSPLFNASFMVCNGTVCEKVYLIDTANTSAHRHRH